MVSVSSDSKTPRELTDQAVLTHLPYYLSNFRKSSYTLILLNKFMSLSCSEGKSEGGIRQGQNL